jgi:hypothetical protein
VTTGADHEIGNVEKCLAPGLNELALLSLHRGTRGNVRDVAYAGLPEDKRSRAHFMSPEEFFTFLDVPGAHGQETTVDGSKVKVNRVPAGGGRDGMPQEQGGLRDALEEPEDHEAEGAEA